MSTMLYYVQTEPGQNYQTGQMKFTHIDVCGEFNDPLYLNHCNHPAQFQKMVVREEADNTIDAPAFQYILSVYI